MSIIRGSSTPPALRELTTAPIAASIASTAVDVFVYDTRKDSDGGAWRKRCQNTSWYNETLNTATRGARREFPAVAVIVGTSTTVTIYDGDDPDLPMWMVFTNTNSNAFLRSIPASTISMVNGVLAIGSTAWDVMTVNFISESYALWAAQKYTNSNSGNIAKRNDAASLLGTGYSGLTASRVVNDLAMIVLPNAPIDSATGLPIPTIAVATDNGYTVINNTGYATVFNIYNYVVKNVAFHPDGNVWANIQYSGIGVCVALFPLYMTIPSNAWDYKLAFIEDSMWSSSHQFAEFTNFKGLAVNNKDKLVYIGTTNEGLGLNTGQYGVISYNEYGANYSVGEWTPEAMSSIISTKYNTGWLAGAVRGAWLCDTTSETITAGSVTLPAAGKNLLNNSINFSSGWSINHYNNRTTNASTSNGVEITNVSAGDTAWSLNQTGSGVIAGAWYKVTFSIRTNNTYLDSSSGDSWRCYVTLGGTKTYFPSSVCGTTNDGWETRSFLAQAGSANSNYTLQFGADTPDLPSGAYVYLRNASVKFLGEVDRTAVSNGLQVVGTLTKSPVATGADLVGYSGFSSSNYLNLPAGTYDLSATTFSMMCWFKTSSVPQDGMIMTTGTGEANKGRFIYVQGSTGYLRMGNWNSDVSPTIPVNDGAWHMAVANWQYVSGTTFNASLYLDGQLIGTSEITGAALTDTSIRIGGGTMSAYTRYFDGSVSLARFSQSIPSADQIKKMYSDEKALFQPGAKAVLYGNSDVVTSLAYDDATNQLHVGTSSGRSVFNGLRRVDNTTTAVTTAISASNGMVVEQ